MDGFGVGRRSAGLFCLPKDVIVHVQRLLHYILNYHTNTDERSIPNITVVDASSLRRSATYQDPSYSVRAKPACAHSEATVTYLTTASLPMKLTER